MLSTLTLPYCVRAALEHVCLASCRRVTDVGMAVLTALPALRRVTLSRCPAVSEVRRAAMCWAHEHPARRSF